MTTEIGDLAAAYHRDGYVVVKGVLSPAEATRCRDAILGLLPKDLSLPPRWLSGYSRIKPRHPDGNDTYAEPDLLPSWQNEKLAALVGQILGSDRLRVFDGSVSITLRHDPGRKPLFSEQAARSRIHIDNGVPRDQDQFRLDGSEGEICGCYYLTDVAPGGGGLRVLPGGHQWVRHRAVATGGRHLYDNWSDIVDIREDQMIEVTGQAGDFVMFDYLMPHAGTHNVTTTTRVAQFLHWVRDDNPYSLVPPTGSVAYRPEQQRVLTALGRKLVGIDPWPVVD